MTPRAFHPPTVISLTPSLPARPSVNRKPQGPTEEPIARCSERTRSRGASPAVELPALPLGRASRPAFPHPAGRLVARGRRRAVVRVALDGDRGADAAVDHAGDHDDPL